MRTTTLFQGSGVLGLHHFLGLMRPRTRGQGTSLAILYLLPMPLRATEGEYWSLAAVHIMERPYSRRWLLLEWVQILFT